MFFKNRTQQDIDAFRGMQEGLRSASHKDQPEESGTTTNPKPANQSGTGANKTGNPIASELASASDRQQHSTVTSEATWEGKLRTEASARVEGTISGEIEAGETVYIANGAHVHANIHARHVVVAGDVEGEITCREQLVVEQSGRLKGKVTTKTIVIAEGAVVQSQIQMLDANAPAKPAFRESTPRDTDAALPQGK